MPILKKENNIVLFIHIPRTGGTSVERWLRSNHFVYHGLAVGSTNPRTCSPQHFHAELLREYIRKQRIVPSLAFSLVREPVDRLVSEYYFPKHNTYRTGNKDNIDRWVEDVLDEAGKNPFAYDNHLRPQHEFLLPGTLLVPYPRINEIPAILSSMDSSFSDCSQGMGWVNKSRADKQTPSGRSVRLIQEFYRDDYRLLSGLFSADSETSFFRKSIVDDA